jgi:hypothetical protein
MDAPAQQLVNIEGLELAEAGKMCAPGACGVEEGVDEVRT